MLFIQFILKFKRHLVISILSLLQLHSSLMNLCKDIKIFMLVHWSLVCLVYVDVVFLSHFFYLGLHHSIVVIESFVGIFSLANRQLKFFFYLFLNRRNNTFEVIFSLIACYLASSSSYSTSSSSYYSPPLFDYSYSCFCYWCSSLWRDSIIMFERFKFLFLHYIVITVQLQLHRYSIEYTFCRDKEWKVISSSFLNA